MNNSLKNLVNKKELTRTQKLLLVLSASSDPVAVSVVLSNALKLGVRDAKKWNISSLLAASSSLAIRTESGWELSDEGRAAVQTLKGSSQAASATVSSARTHLIYIKTPATREFLEEAIGCFEQRHFRAATVLSWVGAMDLLYERILERHLSDFNAEALKRNSKWRLAKTKDDLGLMTEHDFLEILQSISVLGKNVKQELQGICLKLRNACGHPNSLKVSENRVAAHLDMLILNVFSQFS